jgi:FkbM family methyltransferase
VSPRSVVFGAPRLERAKLRLLRLVAHQRWLRFGVRDRLLRGAAHPQRLAPRDFETEFFGLRYHGSLGYNLDRLVYFYGAYEREELLFLRAWLAGRPGAVCLDVGASVGQHTLFFATCSDRVHAFEPYEPLRRKLEARVAANRLAHVVVHPVGLGECTEPLVYHANRLNPGAGSFVAGHDGDNEPVQVLQVVRGDEYLASLGLERLDLVKVDVEGFEGQVLAGLAGMLERFRPAVMMEFSDTTRRYLGTPRRLMELLPAGYRVSRLQPNRAFLGVFNRPSVRREAFDFTSPDANLWCCPGPRGGAAPREPALARSSETGGESA